MPRSDVATVTRISIPLCIGNKTAKVTGDAKVHSGGIADCPDCKPEYQARRPSPEPWPPSPPAFPTPWPPYIPPVPPIYPPIPPAPEIYPPFGPYPPYQPAFPPAYPPVYNPVWVRSEPLMTTGAVAVMVGLPLVWTDYPVIT
jgi:hypothetical protein